MKDELITYLKLQLEKCKESSPKWDKYTSRMSGDEAYADILYWIKEYEDSRVVEMTRQRIIERYIVLPASEAIDLYESVSHDNNLILEMTEALLNLYEMSVYSAIRNASMRPKGISVDSEKDEKVILDMLSHTRKFLGDKDLTIKDAVKINLETDARDKKDFAIMSDTEQELFYAKLDYYVTKYDR